MLESSRSLPPQSKKYSLLQWLFANSIGAGIGIGLPMLIADRLPAPSYSLVGAVIAALLGLWLGLVQWLVLRQTLLLPGQWVLATGLSAVLAIVASGSLALAATPLALLLLLTYPLSISFTQWRILRSMIQPSWGWSVVSTIAIFVGGLVGLIIGIIAHEMKLSPGIVATIGGLSYGFIYGLITHFSLKSLTQKATIAPPKQGLDRPPDSASWHYWGLQVISGISLFLLAGLWMLIFPWPTNATLSSIIRTTPMAILMAGLIVFVYPYFAILVHELGHLGFALSQQFDFRALAVNRVILTVQKNGLQLGRARRPFAGGFLLSVPRSAESLNKRVFMMILGGPVGSLILAVMGMLPWLLRPWFGISLTAWCMGLLSVISLHMAILNAIPMKVGYLSTDGRRMVDLIQNNRAGQRFAAAYAYNASSRQGMRPRDIDPSVLDRLLAIPDKSSEHISALLIAYQVELDRGCIPQAANYLDEALSMHLYVPEMFRAGLLLEGAYFEAMIRDRADMARQWLNQIQETIMTSQIALRRAEAAVCLVEGDAVTALAKAQEGLTLAHDERLMPGMAVAEAEWLNAIIDQANVHERS
jgi:hypothetical protein